MPSIKTKKPQSPQNPQSATWRVLFARKWALGTLLVGLLVSWVGKYIDTPNTEIVLDYFRGVDNDDYWSGHQDGVKQAFTTSWDAYARYSWGKSIAVNWSGYNIKLSVVSTGVSHPALEVSYILTKLRYCNCRKRCLPSNCQEWRADEP